MKLHLSVICLCAQLVTNALALVPGPVRGRTARGALSKLPDISEKLVFDVKTGRFFERDLKEICEEEFCLMDNDSGQPIMLTREEKERIFLDALQSYYYNGKSNLPDEQFNRLKEDLSWEGSVLVNLNRNETKFLEAKQAYNTGKSIMTDAEFDQLKTALKESKSKLAVQTEPQCYVDTGVCKVTWIKNDFLTGSLYIPAGLVASLGFLGVTFEIANGLLNTPINPILLLLVGFYPINLISKKATDNFLFKDPLVASGPCPKCQVVNKAFFGDVLFVEGDAEESVVKCTNCKELMTIKRNTLRVSTLAKPRGPPVKASKDADDE